MSDRKECELVLFGVKNSWFKRENMEGFLLFFFFFYLDFLCTVRKYQEKAERRLTDPILGSRFSVLCASKVYPEVFFLL